MNNGLIYIEKFKNRYQVFTLFFGMFLALPFKLMFNSNKKYEPRDELIIDMPKKKVYSVYLLIFPSMCDVFATILDCIGLIYVKIKKLLKKLANSCYFKI